MDTAKIGDLAGLFGVTERQARTLLTEAGVKPSSRGIWPMPDAVRAVFRHIRSTRQASAISEARARQIAATARKTEMATARAERELIPVSEASFALNALAAYCRQEIDSLPARLTRDRAERARIEVETRGALTRIVAKLHGLGTKIEAGASLDDLVAEI